MQITDNVIYQHVFDMQTLTEAVARLDPPMGIFDETVVHNLFPDRTTGSRNALVHRAVSCGEVLRLKPGLYCLGPPWTRRAPHPFAVASLLLSPSHVSLESALWHHGLIPEGVREVASVTPLRSRNFDTALGSFTFQTVPTRDPRAGTRAVEIDREAWVFVATPIRAIADLIYLRPSVDYETDGLAFLTDSLRLDLDALVPIDADEMREITSSMRGRRTRAYLAGMTSELGT